MKRRGPLRSTLTSLSFLLSTGLSCLSYPWRVYTGNWHGPGDSSQLWQSWRRKALSSNNRRRFLVEQGINGCQAWVNRQVKQRLPIRDACSLSSGTATKGQHLSAAHSPASLALSGEHRPHGRRAGTSHSKERPRQVAVWKSENHRRRLLFFWWSRVPMAGTVFQSSGFGLLSEKQEDSRAVLSSKSKNEQHVEF